MNDHYRVGIVKKITSKNDYGFLEIPGEHDVWFHLCKGGTFSDTGNSEPIFIPGVQEIPPAGTRIMFLEQKEGLKGRRALWWATEKSYTEALESIESSRKISAIDFPHLHERV